MNDKSQIKVHDIFKAAFLWLRTGQRPDLKIHPVDQNFYFYFNDSPSVQRSIEDFMADKDDFKSYSDFFKNLRNELYTQKGRQK